MWISKLHFNNLNSAIALWQGEFQKAINTIKQLKEKVAALEKILTKD